MKKLDPLQVVKTDTFTKDKDGDDGDEGFVISVQMYPTDNGCLVQVEYESGEITKNCYVDDAPDLWGPLGAVQEIITAMGYEGKVEANEKS